MRILAIDTATEACSVALWNNGTINAHFELCPREHTQRILPMVQEILAASGVSLNEIDALAFGRGPGSFTGVRIGIGYCARAGVRGKSADDRCFDACHDGAGRVA
ncbi:metal-dependent protease-like protein, putative molecular chaperone [Salmonella enterica subsp. enterica]|uniref:tRNA threonylcarbamoyladenosine biosynthesis protein TsaB n=1 Tax=Salmonella enterica I TaxID=59201 RepID=A0A379WT37_SALET|nr:metal-dependent protease-like protein, putative molecular chaperone [Salmonella enterica subsp. enterica]